MKKTMRNIGLGIVVCTALLSSCTEERMGQDAAPDRRIRLRATVESASSATRMPFPIGYTPDKERPLEVAVWASTTQWVYKDEDKNGTGTDKAVALHTKAKFTAPTEQLLDDAVYPDTQNTSVWFVGLHPQTGWATADGTGTRAVHTSAIDGKTDVMFASHISGTYGGNVNTWPTFTFRHLLTWLRVQMVAESEAVSEAWGKVTGLTVNSPRGVEIDLSREYDASTCVNFTDSTVLNFYRTDTDNPFPGSGGYQLKGPLNKDEGYENYIDEVAYVLCAPVMATAQDTESGQRTAEYTLHVTTEKRNVTVKVDLMDAADSYFNQSTMNHRFILLLTFGMGDNISVMAVPTDWTNGGMGSETLGE